MRFILASLLTALLAFIAGIFLPWWVLAVVAFGVALLLPQSNFAAFCAGFVGIFLMWGLVATWIDVKNESLLTRQVAQLLPLGGSPILLILVTALVGGLLGGFAALSGNSLRRLSAPANH